MAERRMFAKTIIDSDAFLDMPLSTQALYFHLGMRADDDGFINNPRKIQRMIGSSDDDLKILIAKRYVIPFESGVICIKHWKINNYIQKDRYKQTVYQKEKSELFLKDNGSYSLQNTACIHDVYKADTQVSIGKVSIDNNYIYSRDNVAEDASSLDETTAANDAGMPEETAYTDDACCKVANDASSLEETATQKEEMLIDKIIDYLNKTADSRFSKKTKSTRSKIRARLREGFTAYDFKEVIDKKCMDWKGTDFEQYLRPETLFGNKFEGYLNAKKNGKRIMPVYSQNSAKEAEIDRDALLNELKKEFERNERK